MKTAHFHDVFMVLPVILYKIIGFSWYMPNSSSRIDTLYPDFHFPLRNNVKISEHAPNFNVFKPRLVYR